MLSLSIAWKASMLHGSVPGDGQGRQVCVCVYVCACCTILQLNAMQCTNVHDFFQIYTILHKNTVSINNIIFEILFHR
jgi:hypothetical protein